VLLVDLQVPSALLLYLQYFLLVALSLARYSDLTDKSR
jgi:hypothetical protein